MKNNIHDSRVKAPMRIHVLLFGPARLLTGKQQIFLDLPHGATIHDAMEWLLRDYPQLQKVKNYLRYAVDAEYTGPTTLLQEGQTLAVIPPVQGG